MSTASLSRRVYNEILDRLLSGRLAPGEVFNRRAVAAELGVSVAPVLEAMLELQAEGLIETLPRKGTRVRQLTLEDLQGQLILREALEAQAARLFCGPPIDRHLKRLTRLAEEIDASDLRSPGHMKEEVRFHHYLVSLAGVPALTDAYDRIMKLGFLYSIQVLHPNHAGAPKQSHVEFVQALRTTDPDKAEATARAHARSGKEAFFERWKQPGGTAAFPTSPAWLTQ